MFLLFLTVIAAATGGCGDISLDTGGSGSGFLLASSVSAGDYHACAVSSGKVKCWGLNTSGQLGNNTVTSSLSPVLVSGITDAVQVSAGGRHTCARLSNGTAWCWGDNVDGQLGNGTFVDSLVPVQVSGLSGATSISSGASHTCAVLADGSLWCWGRNIDGQLGDASNTDSSSPVEVSGITTASAVAAGGSHTCARLTDSTLQCWGSNLVDQLGNIAFVAGSRNTPIAVTGINTAVSLSAGNSHTCAEIASPSRVRCWGNNVSGQLARLWPTLPLETSSPEAQNVASINTPAGVAAGLAHSCSVLTDNTVWCWGENFDGQLGNGSFAGFFPPNPSASATSTIVPVAVSGINSATQITAGLFHSCALLASNSVMCWGRNSSGQLGNGTGVTSLTPVLVTDTTGAGLQ